MPRYISKGGVWYPAKEKVGLVNRSKETKIVDGKEVKPGEPYVYEGADRAALLEMWQVGVENFGEDFRKNQDFLQSIRSRGFKTVNEFLKFIGYDKEKEDSDFKEKAAEVVKHELPEKVAAIRVMGGGADTSGGGLDKEGGFGPKPND